MFFGFNDVAAGVGRAPGAGGGALGVLWLLRVSSLPEMLASLGRLTREVGKLGT